MQYSHRLRLAAFLTLVAIPGVLAAQTDAVYVANSANNHILRILPADFEDTSRVPEVVNPDANLRKQLQGLVVRALDELIVCDTLDGKVLFYSPNPNNPNQLIGQTISDAIALPDGVSLGFDGSLFLVNSGPGSGKDKAPKVWTIPRGDGYPGGYGEPQVIDPAVPAELLEDTRVVRSDFAAGGISTGDLLVLSRQPAAVWLYPNASPCKGKACDDDERIKLIGEAQFPQGAEPTGFAFDPDGDLLISSLGGTILRYDLTAETFDVFVDGLGNGKFKLSVGIQGAPGADQNRVYVTNRNGGEVIRIEVDQLGNPILENGEPKIAIVTNGIQSPVGVSAVTSNATRIFADGQTATFQNLTATFEKVTTAGLYDVSCISFVDPREFDAAGLGPGEPWDPDAYFDQTQPLPASLSMTDTRLPSTLRNLELEAEIPRYVRAFTSGTNYSGPPTFRLCITGTNAVLSGVVEIDAADSPVIHTCDLPGKRWLEGRMFYAPETGPPKYEALMAEGGAETFFKDITVRCGSHVAWTRGRRSAILDTVRDVRPVSSKPVAECETDIESPTCDIVSYKLHHLDLAMKPDVPGGLRDAIPDDVYEDLLDQLNSARDAFDKGNARKLVRSMDAFLGVLEQWLPVEDPAVSAQAELKERAGSTIFTACKLIKGKKMSECKLCILADDPECR